MAALFLISLLLAEVPAGNVIAPTDYPLTAGEYARGTVVTINSTTLESLQDEQLRALLQFAGSCGRILLVNVSPAIESIIRDDAACDGQFVLATATADDIGARSLELANLPDPARVVDAELLALVEKLDAGRLSLQRLALFWTGYLLIAVTLLLYSRTRLIGLGFSVAATLLVPTVWPPAQSRTLVAWAEVETDDRIAAFFSMEQERTFSHGQFASKVTKKRGSFDLNRTLGFSIRDDNVDVCNYGSGISVSGHIFWRGSLFVLPVIQQGKSWSSEDAEALDATAVSAPELRLFLKHSDEVELSFLRPLPVSDVNGHGWLLQYAGPDQKVPTCER
jgi:hypothetical protein